MDTETEENFSPTEVLSFLMSQPYPQENSNNCFYFRVREFGKECTFVEWRGLLDGVIAEISYDINSGYLCLNIPAIGNWYWFLHDRLKLIF